MLRLRSLTFGSCLLLGSGLGFACSDHRDETALVRSAIVNGMRSDEADNAVVDVYAKVDKSTTRCTGTLIAPNILATALHCVSYYDSASVFKCNPDGTITADNPEHGKIGGPVEPEGVEVHFGPEFDGEAEAYGVRIFTSGSSQICRNDIAIVILDRELEPPVEVPLRLDRAMVRRESMRIVGFGETEVSGSSGRYVRTGVRVTEVGPDSTATTGAAAPRTFLLGEGACHGDSGGPAFSEETGALTGVYSLSGGPTCTSVGVRNVYTKIAPFAALFREAFEFAGREPLAEPPLVAGAGGGGAGSGGAGNSGAGETAGGNPSTAGSATAGSPSQAGRDEPEPSDDDGTGSGSREDPSCTCTTVGAVAAQPLPWAVFCTLLLAAGWRRRHRG